MILLAAAVLLFSAVHLIPALPRVKSRLKDRFGQAYGPLFGVIATITLIGVIAAWSFTGFEPVFEPIKYGRYINLVLSFVAFGFLGIFAFRGRLRQFFRFPFAIAVMFWAIGHLFANGDLASIIGFGGLLIFAVGFHRSEFGQQGFPQSCCSRRP